MWVKPKTSTFLRKFLFFALLLAATVMVLYGMTFESWVNKSSGIVQPTDIAAHAVSATSVIHSATSTPRAIKIITPWKKTMTTLFWVGEPADADNAFITNTESYWDENWREHYGGTDDPDCRIMFQPCGFIAKENPFYVALPYAEYDSTGSMKSSVSQVPWYSHGEINAPGTAPFLKNRWVAVRYHDHVCYGQWEDVGPNGEDDVSYVFGKTKPTNTFGERAGLDISPAMWKCLGIYDNTETEWSFVDASEIPEGAWKDVVTSSRISWH